MLFAADARADIVKDQIDPLLAEARRGGCSNTSNELTAILCSGQLRVGVRDNYRGFGFRDVSGLKGFEIDVASRIAERLGVAPVLSVVTPTNRISKLVGGEVDVVIATMTHTVTRDAQINFVRPHYFASHTAIMGPRHIALKDVPDLAGRTVCVPVGSASNIVFARANARLMLYDAPQQLIDALTFGTCSLAAHDNTLWAAPLLDARFANRFQEKIALEDSGWGIGIRASGSDMLEQVLSLIVMDLHRSKDLIQLASRYQIPTTFLRNQNEQWNKASCLTPVGRPDTSCLLNPFDDVERPTSFAGSVKSFEIAVDRMFGIKISLPMLTGHENYRLFVDGIVNTIILVVGSLMTTLAFAILFQAGISRIAAY